MAFHFLSKGLVLEQHKEPALSRDLRELIVPGSARPLPLPKAEDPAALSPEEIIAFADAAGIIDERDSLPLGEKLRAARRDGGTAMVVADAIDDEPYVSSQLGPLFKLSSQAVGGLLFAAKAAGAQEIMIGVYKNVYDLRLRIPNTLYGVKIKRITGKYPAEARSSFPECGEGVLLVGVCALIHLYRAIHNHTAQTTSFLTVAGNCVANPANLEATNGLSVWQALERCGLLEEPARVVIGGPMTGMSILDPAHTPISATTRAVLAFLDNPRERHYSCIGCGKCASVCPQELSPLFLYKSSKQKLVGMLRFYDVERCIGCGTCSYVCPAKLELSAEILSAKRLVEGLDKAQPQTQPQEGTQEDQNDAQSV